MNELPLILAGPILRRVEPTLVAVWVALSKSCTVQLDIYRGLLNADKQSEQDRVAQGTGKTLRIGDQLHIVVTTASPQKKDDKNGVALLPEQLYSYNITLTNSSGKKDLKSEKLLQDGTIKGKPHLALGYASDILPSFALPPVALTDLRILHGSCRRANKEAPDGLAWVDDFIKTSREKSTSRPHQLFLSGDQIYADDVDPTMLHMLNQTSKTLIGSKEDQSEEQVPIEQLIVDGKPYPADEIHFPPGYRLTLTQNEAKFTSSSGKSHLLSFGEFCAMYLFAWSNACWPDKVPTPKQIQDKSFNLPWIGLIPSVLIPGILGSTEKEKLLKLHQVGKLSSTATEFLLGKDATSTAKFNKEEKNRELRDLNDDIEKEHIKLEQLWKALPKVRRALANVPTYMMFDDHEVTDDWYLNPMWRDRVLTSLLGKTVIRNGLVSYALFQAWGNDPAQFEKGKHKELLEHARDLFPEKSLKNGTAGPNEDVGAKIDVLLGFNGSDPKVTWHYTVPGAKHMVLALDNRTRRSYVSRVGPPGNISIKAMKEQIPSGPLPPGIEVLFVVAPVPVLGPPIFDELLAPLAYRAYDIFSYGDLQKQGGTKGMPGTNPDAIEGWAFDPKTFEALLKRLEPYRTVVFLSGDVHYASSQVMSYWKKGTTEPARFAQFTSSGLRNTMPKIVRLIERSFAFAQRMIRADIGAERIGWDKKSPSPLNVPDDAIVVPALRSKLNKTPVMIPSQGWPEGTTINPDHLPDWSWRVEVIRDKRPDSERPKPAQPVALPADLKTNIEGYRSVAIRHAGQLDKLINSRQILFANNLGLVRFENRDSVLHAIHELYTVHPDADNPEKAELYTLHVVPMQNPSEKKPEEKLISKDKT